MSEVILSRRAKGLSAVRAPQSGRGLGFYTYFAVGAALALLFVLPFFWVLVNSVDTNALSTQAPSLKDFLHLSLNNYDVLFGHSYNVLINVINSLIVGASTAVLTVIVSSMAGYGLSWFRFRGAGIVFSVILLALMIPFQAILTPLFLELHFFHLLNNLFGLILLYATFNLPFGVFIMRNSFAEVPRELMDSSKVDGAGPVATLVRVMRPLVLPGMATTAIYAFLYSWNELLQALTFITSNNDLTLPVKLLDIDFGDFGALNYGYMSAGVVIAMVPCIVLYVALQRYYVGGLISGALKG